MPGLPEKIGSYTIVKEIGHGSSSTVYLAKTNDSAEVALKVLHPHVTRQPGLVEWFEREAQTIATLKHDHIVCIFDTKREDEIFFIVMEYVPNGTLRDRLRTGPVSLQEAIHIIRCIGKALIYAHSYENGIIHRDIKPENILLDVKQEFLRPVLADFGLAKSLAVNNQSTVAIGTPYYMAPEQWKNEPLTPVTDLYALAITFFEMLANRPPFRGSSLVELMQKHLSEPLPLLSAAVPNLGPSFDDILSQATAKNPFDRFQNVPAFIEALEAASNQVESDRREQIKRQKQAASIVQATQIYKQQDNYDPNRALEMVQAALDVDAKYVDALRLKGEIRLEQEQFPEALESYEQAYKQSRDPSSEAGIDYLEVLRKVGETYWKGEDYWKAAEYYHSIVKILDENTQKDAHIDKMWAQIQPRLIEFHQREGEKIYTQASSENLNRAIKILDDEIWWLDRLKSDSKELRYKQRLLQIKKYEDAIKVEEETILELLSKENNIRQKNENIIQHYLSIDKYYQNLIELDRNEYEWQESRRKKLKEQVEYRLRFAAEAESEADYETAIQHYLAILDIDQTKANPNLARDLMQKIEVLKEEADYDGKYNQIRRLIDNREYPLAFEYLDNEFIRKRNYEYRDIAKLLWELIQIKKNKWQLPTAQKIGVDLKTLNWRLLGVEQMRVQQLRNMLESWLEFSEVVESEKTWLVACKQDINRIEEMLSKVELTDAASKCHAELTSLKDQIQKQNNSLDQIDILETHHKLKVWLQRINDAATFLQEDNTAENIQEFIDQHDVELTAIEKDRTFEMLRTARMENLQIKQKVDQLAVQIKRQFIEVLTQDINQKKEELVNVRKELTELQLRKGTIIYNRLRIFLAIGSSLSSLALGVLLIGVNAFWSQLIPLVKGIVFFSLIIGIIGIVVLVFSVFYPKTKL